MAERDLVPPNDQPVVDPQTGKLTLPWQQYFSLLSSKIKQLETP